MRSLVTRRTRGSRRRTILSSGPGDRFQSQGAGHTADSGAGRRPSSYPPGRGPGSLMPEGDATASEVVGRDRKGYAVAGKHSDPESAHLTSHGGEDVVPVAEQHAERRVA